MLFFRVMHDKDIFRKLYAYGEKMGMVQPIPGSANVVMLRLAQDEFGSVFMQITSVSVIIELMSVLNGSVNRTET